MAVASSKLIYRVRQVSRYDMAVVVEVREDDITASGPPKEIRNAKLCLGGVDSFWLATGVKPEAKFTAKGDETPIGFFSSSTSALTARIRDKDFSLPAEFQSLSGKGKLDAVSFATAARVSVGYSPDHMAPDELVTLLRAGRLTVPTAGAIDAIEVRKNVWMIDGFRRQNDGFYGLDPKTSIRAVQVVKADGKVDALRLTSGLVVFYAKPRWSAPSNVDLRSDEEILKSAEDWLSRATGAVAEDAVSAEAHLGNLLRSYIASTIGDDEKEDLSAALKLISSRPALLDVIPQMMLRDPSWSASLEEVRGNEVNRLREEVRQSMEVESGLLGNRLDEIRTHIREAEERLEIVSHREVLLRNESERHETDLKDKIADAAKRLGMETSEASRGLREELSQLRDEMSRLERAVATAPVPASAQPVEAEPEASLVVDTVQAGIHFAQDSDVLKTLSGLAETTGLTLSEMISVVLLSMEDVSVLVGPGSARSTAEIAYAIGGEEAAIIFCDPTHVSLQDLINDEAGGFARAVSTAKSNPDILVPVALCGITGSSCEYWLPRLVEMRRLGRLPKNLAFIASAGEDGLRISVPNSVLHYMAPVKVSGKSQQAAGVPFAGHWKPFNDGDDGRLDDAVEILTSTDDPDPVFIKRRTKMLSRVPSTNSIKMSDVAAVLLRQNIWLKSVASSSDHEFNRFFKNIEG